MGVLRDSAGRPLQAMHADAPIALFDACAAAGVRRVVQISALGIAHSATRYASTKRAADEHLLALTEQGRLNGCVLRPSVVFGAGGASSQLFLALARLPALLLPRPVLQARVQPVAVRDLADVVARMAGSDAPSGLVEIGGPEALPLADLIASLRAQMGHRPACVGALPGWLSRASARAATGCRGLLVQRNAGAAGKRQRHRSGRPGALVGPTGRRARTAAGHAAPRLNGNRRMALSAVNTVPCGQRLMHASLVIVWLGTALVSALEHKGLSARLLADAGILDTRWQALLVWSGLLADLAVGLALWLRPGRSSYLAALALMLAMTVTASVLQPALWLHPLGPLLKNLPIAAMLLHLMSAHAKKKELA